MSAENPLVAISYAHGEYDQQIIDLSNRLRGDGIDCEIDAYDDEPVHGWGRWMIKMMTTRIVLVVPSEAYFRRYVLEETTGVGQGVAFESGLLLQRAIEAQGGSHEIIPVLLDNADVAYIPEFLRDVDRYDLSEEKGYERLLRRLTKQPAHPRPPLGTVPLLPPLQSATSAPKMSPTQLVLFHSEDAGIFGMPLAEVDRADKLRLVVLPDDHADVARLRGLENESRAIALAYGSTALFGRIKSFREIMKDGHDSVVLELAEERFDNSFGTEMSYNNISADEIAEMRARRILLDEKLPSSQGSSMLDRLNDTTFESFVSGRTSTANRLVAKSSPIPVLVRGAQNSPDSLAVARLMCVMLLILTGAVERILRLDLTLEAGGVRVEFEGRRHKVYSNVEAPRIAVSGICPIEGTN